MSGSRRIICEVTDAAVDPMALWWSVQDPACGATVLMTGQVRDHHEGRGVEHLEYEAYESMARAELERIADQTVQQWEGILLAAAHRTGSLQIGEVSVVVAVSAPHRGEAFEACRACIDALKARLPVWKKEFGTDGSHWQEGTPLDRSGSATTAEEEAP